MAFSGTVLQIVPRMDAGGAERTTVEIARAIVAAGGRAIVATEGGRLEPELRDAGAEIRRMPLATKSLVRMWRNRQALIRLIRQERVDIVHARSRAPAWSALWAARRTGAAFITTYHGYYSSKSPLKRFYNSVMARGDAVIANSEFIADHICREYGDRARNVLIIPRGADIGVFSPEKVAEDRIEGLRRAWAIERPGPLVALLPGRLTPWKGQSIAIDAAAALRRSGQGGDFLFILAGDAQGRMSYVMELKKRIDAQRVGEQVRIVGHCTDMPAAYSLADIVISTSVRPEAFGRVAVEAQAMGAPVIAADHGGAQETVVGDVTGWRIPPGDPEALAEALRAFKRMSPVGRMQMGAAARRHAVENYSIELMCDRTLDAYEEIMSRRI
ncbi:MAG: glycosyltransferase family 4 protein [Parvularculaceae bacterium]